MGTLGWLLAVAGSAAAVGVIAYVASGGAAQAATTPTPTGGSGGSQPTPTPIPPATSSLPAGPYTNLGKGAKLVAGNTYLTSGAGSGAGGSATSTDVSQATAAFQGAGYTVLGSWTTKPPGWPSDPLTVGLFYAVTAGSAATNGQDVTTWATGGATS